MGAAYPRSTDLSAIEIERQRVQQSGEWRLKFSAVEMKGGRSFEYAWPELLRPALERYLLFHRTILRGRDRDSAFDQALWIAQFGRRLSPWSVPEVIERRTRDHFGMAMNAQTIRHVVCTTVAEHSPEHIADIPAVMAHADLETAEKHYILAGGSRAIEKYHAALIGRSLNLGRLIASLARRRARNRTRLP